jgi:hypothetical protein
VGAAGGGSAGGGSASGGSGGSSSSGGGVVDAGPPPPGPVLTPDQQDITFGGVFGAATYVGQQALDDLAVTSVGLTDVTITAITLTGDPEFSMVLPGPLPVTLHLQQSEFVQARFFPMHPGSYSGLITVTSNAPTLMIPLSGTAVNLDGG